jgi:hypothetical protein
MNSFPVINLYPKQIWRSWQTLCTLPVLPALSLPAVSLPAVSLSNGRTVEGNLSKGGELTLKRVFSHECHPERKRA